MASNYDLVVIGGGTAGLVSAAGAASLGARVALVERDRLGGDCLYTGCVPTKALVKSARVAHLVKNSGEYGVRNLGYEVDFPAVMGRMRRVIEEAGEHDSPERFRKLGVDVFLEEARFESPYRISVDGRFLETQSVIVATGSHSTTPPVEGLEEAGYVDHVGALALKNLPRSLIVVGSGPIGSEFAQVFARFGSDVSLVSTSPLPLPKEDPEIGEILRGVLVSGGVEFHGGYRAERVRMEGGEKVMTIINEAGHEREVRGEEILVAAGRAPTAGSLALENAGVEIEEKGLTVDEHLRTTAPNVYAAGDITGKYLFTHVAEYQARNALRNALFPVKAKVDHRVVPWTTFTDPEVARVGLTEEQARREHDGVQVFRQPFGGVDRAMADGETTGLVKIVTGKRGRILGGHIIGPDAGNLIHEVVLAMQKNIPVGTLSTTIHVYPTLAQANQRAADNYYREKLFDARNQRIFSAFFGARRGIYRLREKARRWA
ncbi:FAD-dependent oxidoreductase [Rubrobacter tropicus]|uniref:FAD-dependent oxidoreductase n=1 Tax=Rubrobacter tropicus TaxID=2653851 RepID=A0A6G8QAR3_9ACTN|nr:FAD-dependent oxidoreductase [Rubrobacter tropicus]QIN83566.1 FAD-dependent oxidoreductase [Rubrobacter tropicus]